jgi:uncharacterized membrane protein YfcA
VSFDQPLGLLLLVLVGAVTAALNTVAGGGSFLTLPILIMLGLPAGVANATNRVGILAQALAAIAGFHHAERLPWSFALRAVAPAGLGSIVGAWLAVIVPDRQFEHVLALLMLGVTVWTVLAPPRPPSDQPRLGAAALGVGFFAVGIYGGFVQAGVGFFVLALTGIAGLDLVRGNAVKVVTTLVLTVIPLSVFVISDRVAWAPGVALAIGGLVGGALGARLSVAAGHRGLRIIVTLAIVAFAVALLLR